MRERTEALRAFYVVNLAVITSLMSSQAVAQGLQGSTNQATWEVEFRAGVSAMMTTPQGNGLLLPSAGAPFSTGVGRETRRNPTWFFGDGAALLNEVLAVASGVPTSARISPLNDVLRPSAFKSGPAFGGGIRLMGRVSSRTSLGLGVSVERARVGLTAEADQQLESTRASFETAMSALMNAYMTSEGTLFSGPQIAATVTRHGGHYELLPMAFIRYEMGTIGRMRAGIVGGVGAALPVGDAAVFTLVGDYRFNVPLFSGPVPMHETDRVLVRFRTARSITGSLAFELTHLTADGQKGWRVEMGAGIRPARVSTTVSVAPERVVASPGHSFSLPSNPTILFNSNQTPQSSLGGPVYTDFATSSASGVQVKLTAALGYFVRF